MPGTETVRAKEIADSLRVSKQAIVKRAKMEKWPFAVINGAGARGYIIDSLPPDVRNRMIQSNTGLYIKGSVLPDRGDLDLNQARFMLELFDKAPSWSRRKAEARGEIVDAFRDYAQASDLNLTESKKRFINQYNARSAHLGVSDETFEAFSTISRPTLDAWRSKKKQLGLAGLLEASDRGKPRSAITPEMADYIIQLKSQKIHRRPARIHEYLIHKFAGGPDPIPHEATVRRFLRKWEKDNAETVAFLRSPDKWRSAYQAAFGDAGESSHYFLNRMEFDNTPADLLCADKKRYTITAAIDVFSRKARCLVVPTGRSQAIANLLRRICIDWGLIDVMVVDNGKDYVSKHIEAVCGALNIEMDVKPPFCPEKKPHIERFFRSLSMQLFEELSGYVGHNVAERKDIESQKSFAQRMMQSGEVIECRMMPDELQGVIDTWIEAVYHQRTHRSLGISPEAKAGESSRPVKKILDERILDILLAPVGKPTVSSKGIRYQGGRYAAPELADFIRQKVQVRRDFADAGTLYVFDMDSNFICIAKDAALEGLTVDEVNEARNRQKKRVREQARALQTLAKGMPDPMTELIESKKKESRVVSFKRVEPVDTDMVRETARAVADPEPRGTFRPEPEEITAATKEEKVVQLHEEPLFDSRIDRYKYLKTQEKIRTLTEREKGFMEGYEGTDDYYQIFVMPYE